MSSVEKAGGAKRGISGFVRKYWAVGPWVGNFTLEWHVPLAAAWTPILSSREWWL